MGFKEWALVCEALGCGEQSVLVRKGGIAEGREGFHFQHREFFLFPTFFHQQAARVRGEREIPERGTGEIEIRFFAKLDFPTVLTNWETAIALEPFHILTRDVVRERFDYDDAPGVHVAAVRGFRLTEPWRFPDMPAYGGCRSWVRLPEPPRDLTWQPVLTDQEHAARMQDLQRALGFALAR